MSFTSYTDQNRNKYVSLLLEELSDENCIDRYTPD